MLETELTLRQQKRKRRVMRVQERTTTMIMMARVPTVMGIM